MHRVLGLALTLAISIALNAPTVYAQGKPDRITFLTGGVGGSWYSVTAGLSKILSDNGIATSLEIGGGNANILNISAGKAEAGMGMTSANYNASVGQGVFKKPIKNILGLATLFTEHVHTAVAADSNIQSYQDLKGERFASMPKTTGSQNNFEDILRAYGVGGEDNLDVVSRASTKTNVDAMKDRQAVGLTTTGLYPHPSISELAATLPIRLLPVDDSVLPQLVGLNAGYRRTVIPANLYNGVDYTVPTIGTDTVIMVPEDLSEETAYWIVKTLGDNIDALRASNPVFKDITLERMADMLVIDLHPGAKRYYKEVGIIK